MLSPHCTDVLSCAIERGADGGAAPRAAAPAYRQNWLPLAQRPPTSRNSQRLTRTPRSDTLRRIARYL